MHRFFLSALLLSALLHGCMVGPGFEEPAIEPPAVYRFDSLQADSLANLAWWELFQDTILHRLIDSAVVNNPTIRAAAGRIEEARAFAGFNKADLYPRIDITAIAARGDAQPGPINLGKETNAIGFAPTLNWELDFWGKFRRANRAAQQQLLASQYAQRAVLIDLIAEVAATYFQLIGFEAQLQIARQTYETRRAATELIQARFDRGIAAEIDLNQSQIQEAIALSAIPLLERQAAVTENTLSILLGQTPREQPFDSLATQVLPPDIPPGLPSELLLRRPDLQEFYYQLAAQHQQIGIAEAQRLPSISLTGLFGLASNELSSLFSGSGVVWNAGVNLFGPLFNFGKNLRRVEIEQARYEQFLAEYEQRVLVAFKEVEDALIEIRTYRDELSAREFQFRAADNAARLSNARYFGGQTSYLEVLESERQQFNAALDAAGALTDQLIAYVRLYKALGGGWISETERAAETGNN